MPSAVEVDLAQSGLEPNDIQARVLTEAELAATKTPGAPNGGYVIPYYDINSKPLGFYRIKVIDGQPKYKQPKDTPNFIYYPPNFKECILRARANFVIITEGEKKAAAATKLGFPAVALGGVDNWRSKTLILPESTELKAGFGRRKSITAKLPSSSGALPEISTLARGLMSLIDLAVKRDLTIFIVFDSDKPELQNEYKPEVQRAAATLGYELRFRGIPSHRIRQVVLPISANSPKVGLDDFLMHKGAKALHKILDENLKKLSGFPRYPNAKAWLNQQLEAGYLSRKSTQTIAFAILAELDARGQRYIEKASGAPYYFDRQKRTLIQAQLFQRNSEPLHETVFGSFLYQEYGVSAADQKMLTWLAAQFTGEEPIEEVVPHRVVAHPNIPGLEDCIAVQISDDSFILVTPNPEESIKICSNGSYGVLFEQGHVESLDLTRLREELEYQKTQPIEPWWLEVLKEVHLPEGGTKKLAACLAYLSPFLNRWRGTQLPVEMYIGEAGSGKSSLMELRLNIITGRPTLRNAPQDVKDWYSSITNSGGLHVTDNVQFTNKDLRQRLSDEICRIVTEPDPHVELRKLYTTTGLARIPVKPTFAFTSITQPFQNSDIIQRAVVFNMTTAEENPLSNWDVEQLEKFGGREAWFAHQMIVLHKFLFKAAYMGEWELYERSVHRLAHYERCIRLMTDVLGISKEWIHEALTETVERAIAEADWSMEGIKAFLLENLDYYSREPFTSQDIAGWAQGDEDFSDNTHMTNARKLGKYLQSNKTMLKRITGISEVASRGNRRRYLVTDKKKLSGDYQKSVELPDE